MHLVQISARHVWQFSSHFSLANAAWKMAMRPMQRSVMCCMAPDSRLVSSGVRVDLGGGWSMVSLSCFDDSVAHLKMAK